MAPSKTSTAQLRALYRSLLRELPPRPILSPERSPLHQTLRATFTASAPSSKEPLASSTPFVPSNVDIGLAKQLLGYLRAQRTYVGLIERYNPGMGMDQDERVRLTARRVGMDLPVEFDPRRHGNI